MQRVKPSDQAFDKLGIPDTTRVQAQFYVYILAKLNDPDGPPKALLPYYCAYIASEQLQSHDVRLDNVLELGRIKHGVFWPTLERTQNLLCQAVKASLGTNNDQRWTFEYSRLPVHDPPCTRCSNKGLPCLITRFNSTGRDERGDDCQRCLLQSFTCKRERVVCEGSRDGGFDGSSATHALPNTQSYLAETLDRSSEELQEEDNDGCLMYPVDGYEQPRRHSVPSAYINLVLSEDKNPTPSCSKRPFVEDSKPPTTHIDFLDVPCKKRRIKREQSQHRSSLQHACQAATNELNEAPQAQAHGARHEVVQMINIVCSTATEIVQHVLEAGCDSLALKFAIDDLADTLQKLSGDVEPGADGLHERLSALDDEDLAAYKEVLRCVCQRLVKNAGVSVVRDVRLKHVLLPALERRLAYL